MSRVPSSSYIALRVGPDDSRARALALRRCPGTSELHTQPGVTRGTVTACAPLRKGAPHPILFHVQSGGPGCRSVCAEVGPSPGCVREEIVELFCRPGLAASCSQENAVALAIYPHGRRQNSSRT